MANRHGAPAPVKKPVTPAPQLVRPAPATIQGPTIDFQSFFSGRGVATNYVSPSDLPTVIVAVIALAAAAALGGAIPAWRASRLDPNVALRAE